jgi:hypothetical protein
MIATNEEYEAIFAAWREGKRGYQKFTMTDPLNLRIPFLGDAIYDIKPPCTLTLKSKVKSKPGEYHVHSSQFTEDNPLWVILACHTEIYAPTLLEFTFIHTPNEERRTFSGDGYSRQYGNIKYDMGFVSVIAGNNQ